MTSRKVIIIHVLVLAAVVGLGIIGTRVFLMKSETQIEFVQDDSTTFDRKSWVRKLVAQSAAGDRAQVRLPLTHVFEFGCDTPTEYCVSEIATGCFGPYLMLEGETGDLDGANRQCVACTTKDLAGQDDPMCEDYVQKYCATQWDARGYFTGATRHPSVSDTPVDESCKQEDSYQFHVTHLQPMTPEEADGFEYQRL